MGIPILQRDPDPLPLLRGCFSAHVTAHEVGSHPTEVLVPHQRELVAAFVPLVSIDGGMLHPSFAGQRLQWVYGGLGEQGGALAVVRVLLCPHRNAAASRKLRRGSGVTRVLRAPAPNLLLQCFFGCTAAGSWSMWAPRHTPPRTSSPLTTPPRPSAPSPPATWTTAQWQIFQCCCHFLPPRCEQ